MKIDRVYKSLSGTSEAPNRRWATPKSWMIVLKLMDSHGQCATLLQMNRTGAGVRTLLGKLFACAMVFVVLASAAFAQQVNGSIAGLVTDPSGAVIAGAKVVVMNTATSQKTTTTADERGHYLFPLLSAGNYKLTASQSGFSETVVSGITLDVYQHTNVDIALNIGADATNITVEGSAPLVDSSSASLGTVVGKQEIEDLPLNLRQVGSLALTVPGTTDTTGRALTSFGGNGSGFNDTSYSGSGGRSAGNLLLIDGMISRALNNGSFALNPYPDEVKEFKIQNNVYDAEFGITSGTVLNLITESGTNKYHGSIWEYLRNQKLDAQPFNSSNDPNSRLNRNQFGGAFGGPVLKEKLFFFISYEGLRLKQSATLVTFVPSAQQRAGDFSSALTGATYNVCGNGGPANLTYDTGQLFDPATEQNFTCPNTGATVLVGTPIQGNKLTRIDGVGLKVLNLFPVSNGTFTGGNYFNHSPTIRNDDQADARVDYSLGQSDRFFGRYLIGKSSQISPTNLPAFNGDQQFTGHNAVFGWTHIFGPKLLNDLRVGYQEDHLTYTCSACPRPAGTLAGFGIQGLSAPTPLDDEYPNVTFSNFPAWGDGFPGFYPEVLPDSLWMITNSVTKTLGRHTFTAGINLNFWKTDGLQDPQQVNGALSFNGQYSSLGFASPDVSNIADLADLELGYPNGGSYTKNAFVTHLVGGQWQSVFIQDNVHVNSRFSYEVGLRYEYRRQPHDTKNQLVTFLPLDKSYTPGDARLLTALPDAANDALCSDAYYLSANGTCLIASSSLRKSLGFNSNQVQQVSYGPGNGDFSPRLGVSFRPLNSDRLVVNAGAGIFKDLPVTNILGSAVNNNPVSTRFPSYVTTQGAPPPLTNGQPTTSETAIINASAGTLGGAHVAVMPSPNYKTATVYEYSASVQSQLLKNLALQVGFVGSRGIHLDNLHLNGNQAKPGNGDLQPRRPWPDFQTIVYDSYDTFSNYNSLFVKLEKRASNGLSGVVAYTYSKSLDDTSGDSDFVSLAQDDNNPRADYALSDFSIRQRLSVSGVYQLPFGQERRYLSKGGVSNALVGGWNLSSIVTVQSGLPFTVNNVQDYSNTGSLSPRPDRICSGKGKKSSSEWFDASCFSTAQLDQDKANGIARFGNSGRNVLIGPGLFNIDASVIKRVSLGGTRRVEFQAGFFNLFNHVNLGLPASTLGSSGFNTISGAAAARQIQLSLKLAF